MLTDLTIHELAARFRRGDATPTQAAREYLDRIAALDSKVKAYLTVTGEAALARAAEADARFKSGTPRGPLDGVPLGLKDVFCTRGVRTTCGSKILEGFVPPYDATVVARLVRAGAVILGKLNMDEFAMGSSTENSAYFTTRNPWDLSRVPGGSSGGSAAAVAADLAAATLGTDTGGSIRQPAAFCGNVGVKPTYGRVSRFGLVAFGSSLDQVAPFARSVRDLELVLDVIEGPDPLDATTLPRDDVPATRANDLAGLRIGVPAEYFPSDLDDDVRACIEEAIATLCELGAERVDLTLPRVPHALSAYYVVAAAEASSNLARYDGVRYGARVGGDASLAEMMAATRTAGFGREVKRRILLGTHVLQSGYQEAWYRRALRMRALLAADFDTAFARVDLLVGPATPTPAFRLGEKSADPVTMYLSDVLTVPANLAGLPALSVPAGFVERDGAALPVGLQWMGPRSADRRVLAAARVFEAARARHARRPPFEEVPS